MLSENELQSRRAFFDITDDDLRRLASLRPIAEKHGKGIVERLYELLLRHPATHVFLTDVKTVARVQTTQRAYFLGLFDGRCDLAYAEDRLAVGAAHERIGLPPRWYIGAYGRYLRLLLDLLFAELAPAEARAAYGSLTKLIMFDMALAMDSYIAASMETFVRQQAAIRELSAPVISVYERVLLLPLIGTVDSHRAEQISEAVLTRVEAVHAMVLIVDIAGVSVVDTRVADHLLKTTSAVRLLGAETILTGIAPQVAKTIVQRGVDLSSMHTRSQLADGIELALQMVGRVIGPTTLTT